MVYTAATLIFVTSVITLYALILSRKNPIMLLVLIPMLLTSSAYTGYSIYALQGTPITGIPAGKNVEIVWIEPAKPWIRLMIRVENESQPLYYRVEYTDENMAEINRAMAKAAGEGKKGAEGQFKNLNAGGEEKGGTFVFMTKPKSINPGDKDGYSDRNRPGRPQFETPTENGLYNDEVTRDQLDELGMGNGQAGP